jgi:hypothetical protein
MSRFWGVLMSTALALGSWRYRGLVAFLFVLFPVLWYAIAATVSFRVFHEEFIALQRHVLAPIVHSSPRTNDIPYDGNGISEQLVFIALSVFLVFAAVLGIAVSLFYLFRLLPLCDWKLQGGRERELAICVLIVCLTAVAGAKISDVEDLFERRLIYRVAEQLINLHLEPPSINLMTLIADGSPYITYFAALLLFANLGALFVQSLSLPQSPASMSQLRQALRLSLVSLALIFGAGVLTELAYVDWMKSLVTHVVSSTELMIIAGIAKGLGLYEGMIYSSTIALSFLPAYVAWQLRTNEISALYAGEALDEQQRFRGRNGLSLDMLDLVRSIALIASPVLTGSFAELIKHFIS